MKQAIGIWVLYWTVILLVSTRRQGIVTVYSRTTHFLQINTLPRGLPTPSSPWPYRTRIHHVLTKHWLALGKESKHLTSQRNFGELAPNPSEGCKQASAGLSFVSSEVERLNRALLCMQPGLRWASADSPQNYSHASGNLWAGVRITHETSSQHLS